MTLDRPTFTNPDGSPASLAHRHAYALNRAKHFERVLTLVEEHAVPKMGTPSGVHASRLVWRKSIGSTSFTARITTLHACSPALIFNVAFTTPDTHPAMLACGHTTFDEVSQDDAPFDELRDILERFAAAWLTQSTTSFHQKVAP